MKSRLRFLTDKYFVEMCRNVASDVISLDQNCKYFLRNRWMNPDYFLQGGGSHFFQKTNFTNVGR